MRAWPTSTRRELHTHDRFGRRIDQVEFHPSYHALLGGALRHGLHGTPWSRGRRRARRARRRLHAVHRARAVGAVPGVDELRGHARAARQRGAATPTGAPSWRSHAVRPALRAARRRRPRVTMGMGMTEKQGGSDVRANTTRAEPDGDDAWGRALSHHRPQVVLLGADVRRLPGAGAGAGGPELLLPAALAARRHASTRIRIQRLKDKLGNKANASSEVEFDGASGLAGRRRRPRRAADPGDGRDDAARLRARHRRPDAPGAVAGAAPLRRAPGLRQAR